MSETTTKSLECVLSDLKAEADREYCEALRECREKDVLKGHESKMQSGKFGVTELSAHEANARKIERHYTLHYAIRRIREALTATPSAPAEPETGKVEHECSAACIAELEQAVSDAESRANERGREIQRLTDRVRQLEGGIRVFVNKTRVGKGMEVHVSLDDFNALSTILFAEPNILKPAPQPASADAGETEAVIKGPGKYIEATKDSSGRAPYFADVYCETPDGLFLGINHDDLPMLWRRDGTGVNDHGNYRIVGPYVEPPKPPVTLLEAVREFINEDGWLQSLVRNPKFEVVKEAFERESAKVNAEAVKS